MLFRNLHRANSATQRDLRSPLREASDPFIHANRKRNGELTNQHRQDPQRATSPQRTSSSLSGQRLTETLLSALPDQFKAATESPFLRLAGRGKLPKQVLSRWLSQALARLRFNNEVNNGDVDEALRLTEVSKASLYTDHRSGGDQTVSSKIYDLIRGMKESGAAAVGRGRGELNMQRVRELVIAKGFTEENFQRTVDEYALLDVWQVANNGARLVFIEADEENMDDDEEEE